jgi:hypothetical protein
MNVNASGVGPSVVRRSSRASASSIDGSVPAGCHHSTGAHVASLCLCVAL